MAFVFGGEHALDHVLIGAVGGQGDEGGAEEGGPEGVLLFQDVLHIAPKAEAFPGAEVDDFEVVRTGEQGGGAAPAAGDVAEEVKEGETEGENEDDDLEDVCPDDGADATERGVDGC